jgi:hypothetical protein
MTSYEGMNRLVKKVESISKKKWLGLIPLALTTVLALYLGNNADASGGLVQYGDGTACTTKIFYDNNSSFNNSRNNYYFSSLRHCDGEELYKKWRKNGCIFYNMSKPIQYYVAPGHRKTIDQSYLVKLDCATKEGIYLKDDFNQLWINDKVNDTNDNGVNDSLENGSFLRDLMNMPWEKSEIFKMKKIGYVAHEGVNYGYTYSLNEFQMFLSNVKGGFSGTVVGEVFKDKNGKIYRVARYQLFASSEFADGSGKAEVLAFDWKTEKAVIWERNNASQLFELEPKVFYNEW